MQRLYRRPKMVRSDERTLPLALKILSDEFHEGDIVRVECRANRLELTPVMQAEVVEE
jgi:hypothetical protein